MTAMPEQLPAEKRFIASVKAAERKRRQRELDAREGIREVSVRVPSDQAAREVRELAARLMKEAGK